jgi:CheY-like chemotaxis protein
MDGSVRRGVILVVDDDDVNRVTLCEVLAEEGYQVLAAVDGLAALELLERGPRPGLILLDLIMPRMSGWELLTRLAAEPRWSSLPVFVLSASTPGEPLLPAGVRIFVKGRFTLEALLDAVGGACRDNPP